MLDARNMTGRPAGSLIARLLASAALVMVSGAYVVWQQGPRTENKSAGKVRMRLHAGKPAPRAGGANARSHTDAAPLQVARSAAPPAAPQVAPPSPAPRHATVQTARAAAQPVSLLPAYADGDYTGEPVDSDFGPVQVEIIVQGGKIVTVNFLQIPDHRLRSTEISEAAIPLLTQEAIEAQSPRIDIVSSATYTTITFENALYNALQKAQK